MNTQVFYLKRLIRSLLTFIFIMALVACGTTDPTTDPPVKNPPVKNPPVITENTPYTFSNQVGELKEFKGDGLDFRYEVIDGLAIYQGDIILGTEEELELARAALTTASALDTQAVIKDDGASCRVLNVNLCPFRSARWPNGVLPYVIDESSYTDSELTSVRALMQQAAEHYRENTGIRIILRTDQRNFVSVEKPSDSGICGSSRLGVQGGKQILRLSPTTTLGCTVHELGHALGISHEQTREDRDSFVTINFGNIPSNREHNFDKAPSNVFTDYGDYDFDSIMHYRAAAFSSASDCPTTRGDCSIVPINSSININRLGQRAGLSLGDRNALCEVYGNPGSVFFQRISNGASFAVGTPVTFEVAYKLRNVHEIATLKLTSSLDGELRTINYRPIAQSITLNNLSVGEHVLTLEALRGCPNTTTTVTINVTSTTASLSITSPTVGSSKAHQREAVYFRATAQGFATAPIVRWESNQDGLIGESSGELRKLDLSYGTHIITATTANPAGGTLRDTVSINITNDAPTIQIVEPTSNATFCPDELIAFRAVTQDLNEISRTLPSSAVTWRATGISTMTGSEVTQRFAIGRHVVTARATDSQGATAEDSIAINIENCSDTPPTVNITSPATDSGINDSEYGFDGFDDARGQWYTTVTLTGTGSDAEDGTLSGSSLVWRTNRSTLQDAALGTGNSITIRLYAKEFSETHEISLTVTDSDGNTRTEKRLITIWTLI